MFGRKERSYLLVLFFSRKEKRDIYRHRSPCVANKNMIVANMTIENQPIVVETNVIN